MAVITSNGGAGSVFFTAGTTWIGGVAPGPGDSAVIASGDDVTYDQDDAGVDGTLGITVNSGGKLILAATMECVVPTINGGGTVEGGNSFEITFTNPSTLNLVSGLTWVLQATSGNEGTWKMSGAGVVRLTMSPGMVFEYVNFVSAGSSLLPLKLLGNKYEMFECDFDAGTAPRALEISSNALATLRNCYLHGASSDAIRIRDSGGVCYLYNCEIGKTRAGASDPNAKGINVSANGTRAYLYNCLFDVTGAYFSTSSNNTVQVFAQANDRVPGEWELWGKNSRVMRSTAAADAGTHGIEFIASAGITGIPMTLHLPIPVKSGDDLSSWTCRWQIKSPSGSFNGSAGDVLLTLDPGNEWGLREVQEPNYGTEDAFQTITFAGGTAGGTAKKGSVILLVEIHKYVASVVHYLADPKVV